MSPLPIALTATTSPQTHRTGPRASHHERRPASGLMAPSIPVLVFMISITLLSSGGVLAIDHTVGYGEGDALVPALDALGINQPAVVIKVELQRTDLTKGEDTSTPFDVPVTFDIDLKQLDTKFGMELSPYGMRVLDADLSVVPSSFQYVSPGEIKVAWMARADQVARPFYVVLNNDGHGLRAQFQKYPTLGIGDAFRGKGPQESLAYPYVAPTVMDWDGDGVRDVIVGSIQDFVHVFRNLGTDRNPILSEIEKFKIMADGKPIAYNEPYHALARSIPVFADFNQDGYVDILLTGEAGVGGVLYFQNKGYRGEDGSWDFHPGVQVPNTQMLYSPRVAVHDWDGDGINDLILTQRRFGSMVYFVRVREWVDGRPVTEPAKLVRTATGSTAQVPEDFLGAFPHIVDWDGDGYHDLLISGSPNYLLLFRHSGTMNRDGTPRLEPAIRAEDAFGFEVSISGAEKTLFFIEPHDAIPREFAVSSPLRLFSSPWPNGYMFSSVRTVPVVSQQLFHLEKLHGFQFMDWFGTGNPDLVIAGPSGIRVYRYDDGEYREPAVSYPVDPDVLDWLGCPDFGEYRNLYPKPIFVDWNGDGLLDLVAVTEHSWRYGYLHLYENLGDWKFGPEREIIIGGTHDWATYGPGVNGQAIVIDHNLYLDFLSYPTAGNIEAAAGSISFWHRNDYVFNDGVQRYFFSSQYDVVGNPGEPSFAARKNADGSLTFTVWDVNVETRPLSFPVGEWHQYEFTWGSEGLRIYVDGELLGSTEAAVTPGKLGRRIHIGSRAIPNIQENREIPSRQSNLRMRQEPLLGSLDDFLIADGSGTELLYLAFDGNADGLRGQLSPSGVNEHRQSGLRMMYGYRSVPAIADLDGDGALDVIIPTSDGTRGRDHSSDFGASYSGPDGTFGRGYLVFYKGESTHRVGPFSKGTPLRHEDGTLFRVHYRTHVVVVDWDEDGRPDIILTSEHLPHRTGQINSGVDLYLNVGSQGTPVFAVRQPMTKLLEEFLPWHDVHVALVDWFGDGDVNLAVTSDGGLRLFKREYLANRFSPVLTDVTLVGGRED